MPASPLRTRSSNKAAALIIVLAFVVLLTGVALAYFSRTTSERQLAHSSYNDTDADLLARTAVDIIVSNFRQEILNGSTATTVNGTTTIYVPKDTGSGPAKNVVPQQSGNISGRAESYSAEHPLRSTLGKSRYAEPCLGGEFAG